MSVPKRLNQGRLGSRKSTTGCITCKIRHVKCDEAKPACRRCENTGRKCDGYAQIDGSQTITLRVSPESNAQSKSDEIRSFEYFVQRVVPDLSQIVNEHFWRDTILQLSRTDGIVWDAVIALSCLVQFPQNGDVYDTSARSKDEKALIASLDHDHIKALKWYNKSITALRECLQQDRISSTIARVSCVIYICIECLQNNIYQAVTLHQQAMALAQAAKHQSKLQCDIEIEESLGTLIRHMSVIHGLPILSGQDSQRSAIVTFPSLAQAREALHLLIREAHVFCSSMEELKSMQGKDWTASSSQKRLSEEIHTKFTTWISKLNRMPNCSVSHLRQHDGELNLLHLAYNHFSIWLSTCLSTYETAYDRFFPIFKSMVEYANLAIDATKSECRPVFVFEARIIPSMFFVATRCRHPVIRRKAISMLRKGPRIENTWVADSMAQVAELDVGIEESGDVHGGFCQVPKVTELPPESHRIFRQKAVELVDDFGQPVHFLNFARWQQDAAMNWVQKEDRIKINP